MADIKMALEGLQLLVVCLALVHVVRPSPPQRKFEIPFLEEQSIGSEVHDLKEELAQDRRAGIRFKMLRQYMTVGKDTVDENTEWVGLDEDSGIISVMKPVDREKDCRGDNTLPCVIHVKIVREPKNEFQVIDIKLNVIDINDHPPVFPVSSVIVINVSESSSVTSRIDISKYLATDADTGTNADIEYTLSRSDYFSIHLQKDPNDFLRLELVVAYDLDHEQASSYDLTLTATDHGTPEPKSSSVTLRVRIVDVNDNPPVFDQLTYHLELQENIGPASVITTVHAEDADSSNFGEIRYFVPESGNSALALELIAVDPVTGEVLLKEVLDRERHNNIRIVIGARDLAGPQAMTGKTILVIEVEDENDNAPVIQITPMVDSEGNTAFLSESADIGTYVAEVTADDADVDQNGEVTLHISMKLLALTGNGHFRGSKDGSSRPFGADSWDSLGVRDINEYFVLDKDGFISTRKLLDRETHPAFSVTIVACDQAVISLCSIKNLTIVLLDENDNAPQFLNTAQEVTLREDTDLGTLVATVKAKDRDSEFKSSKSQLQSYGVESSRNGVIQYILHNGGRCFSIDEEKGRIRLVGGLDYEKKKTWMLVVTAKDKGTPSKSANLSLVVHVTDINDNAPAFSNPAVANQTIAATIQNEDVITKIHAVDYDEGVFSEVLYSIVSEDGAKTPPKIFILDQFNGNLRLNMSNPRLKKTLGTHSLVIKAQDLGTPPLSGYTALRIEVYDVPLSVLPTFITTDEEPVISAGGDLTLILIVSLALAASLLVVILAIIIFKCRRDNKEIRSYNCKNEESKKAWELTAINNTNLTDNVMMMSSNRMMTSRDSNLNSVIWNQSMKTHVTNDTRLVGDSSSSRSSQRSLRRKTNDSRAHPPITSQTDRDSGRGDSDHEATMEMESYGDKGDPMQQEVGKSSEASPSNSSPPIDEPDCGDLGPLCTHLCRQYGHSDSCWMPVTDNQIQTNFYYHGDPQQSRTTPYNPHHHPVYSPNLLPMGGLETINETQPLHSVLRSGYDYGQAGNSHQGSYEEGRYHENYQPHPDAYIAPQTALLHPTESGYYASDNALYEPTYWSNPLSPLDDNYSNATTPSVTSPRQYTADDYRLYPGVTTPARRQSACHGDEAIKEVVTDATYCQPSTTDSGVGSYDGHSQAQSPHDPVASRSRSTSSLHGELLHRRFLAHAHGTPNDADDVGVTSPHTSSHYEEVSMQETQKIIDDIDQLMEN